MRWLHPDPADFEENIARSAVISRIEKWWQAFAAHADTIHAYLHGAAEFELAEFMAAHLDAVDPRLGWEFGALGNGVARLVISVDGELALRPMVEALLALAPRTSNWEFLPARPAENIEVARRSVEAETERMLGRASVRARVSSMNRVDLLFHMPETTPEIAHTQAVIAAERMLGEEALARWVGAIETVTETADGHWLPLDELPRSVFAEVAGVDSKLPDRPLVQLVGELRWSLWRLNPPQAEDYARERDLIMGSSALEEMSACAQLGAPFDSRRYSKVGETFCFLKFDGEGRKVAARMEERKRAESAVNQALVTGGLGCVVGAGTGRRYSYLDLALVDVKRAVEPLRDAMREAGVSERSWLQFHDASLGDEWIGIWQQTPPPPK